MAERDVPPGRKAAEERPDKRQFLVHIDADLIRGIKILAIERDTTASGLVEKALAEFLERNGAALVPGAAPPEASQCS
jgi:precorrin-6B methylase 2